MSHFFVFKLLLASRLQTETAGTSAAMPFAEFVLFFSYVPISMYLYQRLIYPDAILE